MRRPLSSVIARHPVPPLASDLQPLTPLLRRLFSGQPLDTRESFPIGAVAPQTVDVSGHPLPASAMRALADAALSHGGVRALLLNRCRLSGAGVGPLLRLLTSSAVIERLEVKQNAFGPGEFAAIVAAAEHAPPLRALAFGKDAVGAEGGRAAAALLSESTTLTQFHLDEADLGPEGLLALAHTLEIHNRSLAHLSLRGATVDVEQARAFASALSNGCRLRSLSLRDSALDDGAASALAFGVGDSPTLQHLDVAGQRLGPVGIAALADAAGGHPQLRSLDLGHGRRCPAPSLNRRGARALADSVLEKDSSLEVLTVVAADDAVARILVDAVAAAQRPVRLFLGENVSMKTRRRARALGRGVALATANEP